MTLQQVNLLILALSSAKPADFVSVEAHLQVLEVLKAALEQLQEIQGDRLIFQEVTVEQLRAAGASYLRRSK